MAQPIWTPSPQRVADSNLTRFATRARAEHGAPAGDYDALWQWSVDERESFWSALVDFAGVVHTPGVAPVLTDRDRMPGAKWFADTRLNFAENLLARDDGHAALVFTNERGTRRELSYQQLRADVARVAAGLRDLGLVPGDRVAGFMPNLPETVVAMLATTSIGAVWTSCSPDFGLKACSTASGRSSPGCCSRRTAISTAARPSTRWRPSTECSSSCRRWSASSSCRT